MNQHAHINPAQMNAATAVMNDAVLGQSHLDEDGLIPGTPVARFAETTRNLTSLIAQENQMLESRDVSGIKPLQGEKARLASLYESGLKTLRSNPTILGPKGSPTRNKIKEITAAFQNEVRNHGRILLRMKSVTEGIINTISEEASRQTGGMITHYNNQAQSRCNVAGGPAPIAFHELV